MTGITVISVPVSKLKNPDIIQEVGGVRCVILALRNAEIVEPIWYDCDDLAGHNIAEWEPVTSPLDYRLNAVHFGFYGPGSKIIKTF